MQIWTGDYAFFMSNQSKILRNVEGLINKKSIWDTCKNRKNLYIQRKLLYSRNRSSEINTNCNPGETLQFKCASQRDACWINVTSCNTSNRIIMQRGVKLVVFRASRLEIKCMSLFSAGNWRISVHKEDICVNYNEKPIGMQRFGCKWMVRYQPSCSRQVLLIFVVIVSTLSFCLCVCIVLQSLLCVD